MPSDQQNCFANRLSADRPSADRLSADRLSADRLSARFGASDNYHPSRQLPFEASKQNLHLPASKVLMQKDDPPWEGVPVPCSLFPVPCSLFPVPCSLFPVPCFSHSSRNSILSPTASLCFSIEPTGSSSTYCEVTFPPYLGHVADFPLHGGVFGLISTIV